MNNAIKEEGTRSSPVQSSWMTSLGIIEGEVLYHLEKRGFATQQQIIEALSWPSVMVTMSIGSLIREGLVKAKSLGGELVLIDCTGSNKESTFGSMEEPAAFAGASSF